MRGLHRATSREANATNGDENIYAHDFLYNYMCVVRGTFYEAACVRCDGVRLRVDRPRRLAWFLGIVTAGEGAHKNDCIFESFEL